MKSNLYSFLIILLFFSACKEKTVSNEEMVNNNTLTEEKARNAVNIWLEKNHLNLKSWNGLLKISENEMHAIAQLNCSYYNTIDPTMTFTFTRNSNNSWVLTKTEADHETVGFMMKYEKTVFIKID